MRCLIPVCLRLTSLPLEECNYTVTFVMGRSSLQHRPPPGLPPACFSSNKIDIGVGRQNGHMPFIKCFDSKTILNCPVPVKPLTGNLCSDFILLSSSWGGVLYNIDHHQGYRHPVFSSNNSRHWSWSADWTYAFHQSISQTPHRKSLLRLHSYFFVMGRSSLQHRPPPGLPPPCLCQAIKIGVGQ